MMVVAVWPLVSGQWPGRDMFGETPSTPTSLLPPAGKVAAAAPNISHFTSFPFYIPTVVAIALHCVVNEIGSFGWIPVLSFLC